MHPTSVSLYARSVIAVGALAAMRFVTVAGAQASDLGAKVLGVTRYDIGDGQAGLADVLGSALVVAGGAIAIDDDLTTDDQGRAVPVTDPETQRTAGRALSAAAAAGAKVEILLLPR